MLSNEIEMIPIEELKPYEKNAKRHTKKQIEHIIESIRQYRLK